MTLVLLSLVFPNGGEIDQVLLHAAILIAPTMVLVWLVVRLQEGLTASDALRLSESERAEAETLKRQAEESAQREAVRSQSLRTEVHDFRGSVAGVVASVEDALGTMNDSASGLGRFTDSIAQDATRATDNSARAGETIGEIAETCYSFVVVADEIGRHLDETGTVTRPATDEA